MAKLLLPLHCYDESGRVIPSFWFNVVFFWGAKGLLIFVASIALGKDGELIRHLLYSRSNEYSIHLMIGLLFIILWLLVGRRAWFWSKSLSLKWLKPAVYLAVLIDITFQITVITYSKGILSYQAGMCLMISLFLLAYLVRSKRSNIMFRDWNK